MSYKPNEQEWMAYLYGELEGIEKEKMDQYLLENAEARVQLEKYQKLRQVMSSAEDKEVIAPPIFVGDARQRFLWNTPYFKTIISIAASLLLILLAAKFTGARISVSENEFRLGFGEVRDEPVVNNNAQKPLLTATEVQEMINASLNENNTAIQASLKESQQKIDASIRQNLSVNSGQINQLVREAATASQEQIRQYVSGIQTENMRVVKDYFQLTSDDQKKYMQDLLVDFTQYLQQQRANDLQLVQTQLNSLQQNTDIFKQETEQILTSIISSVGPAAESTETRN
jgi:hypothetical protein